jgi:hypothetical protein
MPTPPSATGVPNKTVPTASKGVQIDKKEWTKKLTDG